MLATTGRPWARAWRTRPRWPSCRLPMVGTKAQAAAPGSAARSSAMVCSVRISIPVQRFVGKAPRLHVGEIAAQRRLDGRLALHEVAHEARQLAAREAEHVVQ